MSSHSDIVLLDIETAPLPDADLLLPDFKPRGNIKDAEKQAASVAEKREKALADAAKDPDLCRIVALGAWWEHDPHCNLFICKDEEEEHIALTFFWDTYTLYRKHYSTRLLGYNLLAFDLPIIVRRSLYLDVPMSPIERGKYRHGDVIDLFDILSEQGTLPWRSLDYYCKRLGIPCDIVDDITGADVPGCVARGEWDRIRAHLLADLVKVKGLAQRLGVAQREATVA